MSFINLLDDVVWSDADITARTEAMVHAEVPAIEENILNRKVAASALGQWTLTAEEQALLAKYTQACLYAHQAGVEARQDMALLNKVLFVENEIKKLSIPGWNLLSDMLVERLLQPQLVVGNYVDPLTNEPYIVTQEQVDEDTEERNHAQLVIESMTEDVKSLFILRERFPLTNIVIEENIGLIDDISFE